MAIVLKTKPLEVPMYRFGTTATDGDASMKNLLGGKGANLAEMAKLGIPVPPGFTIPTSMCLKYLEVKQDPAKLAKFMEALSKTLVRGMQFIMADKGSEFLMSVRSGARVSMPGMMDTILNVGLDDSVKGYWEKALGEECYTNSLHRLITMYGDVVHGIPRKELESVEVGEALMIFEQKVGTPFPMAGDQLLGAVIAVFESWNNPRAIEYRKIHGIPNDWGTAVTVQSMVFGNLGEDSCTGVLFTRDPSTGENKFTGEYLVNAQGEDVVAGIRTPEDVMGMVEWNPAAFTELSDTLRLLEEHYKDMQDVEFTVEGGKLYLLQTRNGKRAAKAAFKIARDMVSEGLITMEEAGKRVTPTQLKAAMSDTINPAFDTPPHLIGIAAGGSVVSGVAVFSAEDAVNCKEPCILITKETNPDDIAGMNAAVGILTATGGLTSHAAVVARGMNKACVVGATALSINPHGEKMAGILSDAPPHKTFVAGDKITIDGSTGRVWVGTDVPVIRGGVTPDILEVIGWATGNYGRPVTVYLTPDMTADEMSEMFTQYGPKVYIELATLFGVDASGIGIATQMTHLRKAIEQNPGVQATINFTKPEEVVSVQDQIYYQMFGDEWTAYASKCGMAASLFAYWPDELLERMSFLGDVPDSLTKTGKAKAVMNVSSVADIFNANGPISVSDTVKNSVFGGQEYFNKLVKMISEAEGKDLTGTIATGYHWYEFLTGADDAASSNS